MKKKQKQYYRFKPKKKNPTLLQELVGFGLSVLIEQPVRKIVRSLV